MDRSRTMTSGRSVWAFLSPSRPSAADSTRKPSHARYATYISRVSAAEPALLRPNPACRTLHIICHRATTSTWSGQLPAGSSGRPAIVDLLLAEEYSPEWPADCKNEASVVHRTCELAVENPVKSLPASSP